MTLSELHQRFSENPDYRNAYARLEETADRSVRFTARLDGWPIGEVRDEIRYDGEMIVEGETLHCFCELRAGLTQNAGIMLIEPWFTADALRERRAWKQIEFAGAELLRLIERSGP